jgi:hypothetical protein
VKFNSDFAFDLQMGQDEEIWLADLLRGKTVEVKRDYIAARTGNLFVEFSSRGKASGLATTRADFWAFILDGERVIIVPTQFLQLRARQAYKEGRTVRGGDSNTSEGVLVRVEELVSND